MPDKLPWFKFYPSDWMTDHKLQCCSLAAQGFMIKAVCVLFGMENRGVFKSNGVPWSDAKICKRIGIGDEYALALQCLQELLAEGALCRSKDGAVYSRRMVRDEEKRKKCSEAGKSGGGSPLLRSAPPLKVERPPLNGQANVEINTPLNDPSDSDFFQKSGEREFSLVPLNASTKEVRTKKEPSELERLIEEVANEMCLRHPKKRTCGPAEVRKLLQRIVHRFPAQERLSILSQVNANHASWCETFAWRKDDGEFAKALANWLAPTQERYREVPPEEAYQPSMTAFANSKSLQVTEMLRQSWDKL